jgi:hypothetical protein
MLRLQLRAQAAANSVTASLRRELFRLETGEKRGLLERCEECRFKGAPDRFFLFVQQ